MVYMLYVYQCFHLELTPPPPPACESILLQPLLQSLYPLYVWRCTWGGGGRVVAGVCAVGCTTCKLHSSVGRWTPSLPSFSSTPQLPSAHVHPFLWSSPRRNATWTLFPELLMGEVAQQKPPWPGTWGHQESKHTREKSRNTQGKKRVLWHNRREIHIIDNKLHFSTTIKTHSQHFNPKLRGQNIIYTTLFQVISLCRTKHITSYAFYHLLLMSLLTF